MINDRMCLNSTDAKGAQTFYQAQRLLLSTKLSIRRINNMNIFIIYIQMSIEFA